MVFSLLLPLVFTEHQDRLIVIARRRKDRDKKREQGVKEAPPESLLFIARGARKEDVPHQRSFCVPQVSRDKSLVQDRVTSSVP